VITVLINIARAASAAPAAPATCVTTRDTNVKVKRAIVAIRPADLEAYWSFGRAHIESAGSPWLKH